MGLCMENCGVAIIGSGMAGFGAANALHERGLRGTIYEARPTLGGHTSTHYYDDGYTFDEGPHISFTEIARLQDLFAESVGQKYETLPAYVNNYWQGHWIKHPAQVNLHGLPEDLVIACIRDFITAQHASPGAINNYEDWLLASFGPTFASTFPMQYTRKYHTTEARNLTTDWLGPRLYQPKIEEVLRGAISPNSPDVHYVSHFRYPTHRGFVSYLDKFVPMADLKTGFKVIEIDPAEKQLTFANGEMRAFSEVVSSMPLPNLLKIIKGAPKDVVDAAQLLACSQVVLVNIGLKRPFVSDANWTYFYDDDICFARLSFPSNFSPNLTPQGCSSVQAEVYFSEKWKPLTGAPGDWIEPVIDGLIKCGLVKDRSEINHTSTIFAPWANVIFDYDRPKAIETVHGYLDDVGVGYCGRYGDWAYIWTDQSFISGERAARRALGLTGDEINIKSQHGMMLAKD